jgi:sugar phosphate permease
MPRIRWLIIWMCFLANAVSYIDRANLAIAAPAIRAELGIDAAAMGLVLSAFFWTYAAMQLPAGWFIDKLGVRISLLLPSPGGRSSPWRRARRAVWRSSSARG